jgi:hypothetical protein
VDQPETTWENQRWTEYFGYYKAIPELRIAIDALVTWTVGKGFKADPDIKFILDGIKGWGKDTFNSILENLIRTYQIGGDAFAERIRDKDGNLINLKPLDPGSIIIVVDRKGIVKRYEQKSKVKGVPRKKFQPEDIFHLPRNRVADEIHGVSLIEPLTTIILMRNEAMEDFKTVMHRNVSPVRIWNLDTDDTSRINTFIAKVESMAKDKENIFIPKGSVELNQASVAPNATLNPLPWIDTLNQYFFQAVGVPDIIIGSGKFQTEASAKIAYLAFQQRVEEEQLFIEEEIGYQLGIEIQLEFPASLENELLSDKAKDVTEGAAQPNETTADISGRT